MVLNSITLELTTRCNFRCIHCYQKDKTLSLGKSFVENIVENSIALKQGYLLFTGGEPMLYDDFMHIYKRARECGVPIVLFTNGSFLHSFFESEQIVPNLIEVSIYGFTPDTYVRVTGTDAFSSVYDAVSYMARNGINFKLKYILMKQNCHELSRFIEYCRINKCPFTINPALLPTGDDYRLAPEELQAIQKENPSILRYYMHNDEHFCTIGSDIIFSADGGVRGCPVMPAFQKAKERYTSDGLLEVLDAIGRSMKTVSYEYCPAWETREERSVIKRYAEGGKRHG